MKNIFQTNKSEKSKIHLKTTKELQQKKRQNKQNSLQLFRWNETDENQNWKKFLLLNLIIQL